MSRLLNMTIDEALKCFDVYFEDIEGPEDYFVEFGRWVAEKYDIEVVQAGVSGVL